MDLGNFLLKKTKNYKSRYELDMKGRRVSLISKNLPTKHVEEMVINVGEILITKKTPSLSYHKQTTYCKIE